MASSCRDCSEYLRDRCIDQSIASPSIKMMMRRAFSGGTDTEDMWGLLQMNCPLPPTPAQETAAVPAEPWPDESWLEESDAVPALERPHEEAPVSPAWGRYKQTKPIQPEVAAEQAKKVPLRYCLTLQDGYHRIALAASGQIVMGRFDPTVPLNPDVDLSYDDRGWRNISRRHARVIGHEGNHLIEDLGSTNGTMVNDKRLRIGQKVLLQPGDRVTLGNHQFLYTSISSISASPDRKSRAYLWVTFTGHRFSLPEWGELIVGRSDPALGFVPDIDLGGEEAVARVVARHHAKIDAREGRHYVEDLGSANGTKLNGIPIELGARGLLEPGDHLWLGGCVLAYDVEP